MNTSTRDICFEALPFPVLMLDHKMRVIDLNPAAEQIFKQGLNTAKGKHLTHWLLEDSPLLKFLNMAQQDQASRFEAGLTMDFLQGDKVEIAARAAPCTTNETDQSKASYVVSLFPEVVSDGMANRQVKHGSLPLSTLVAMLAHEIKNPLSGIKGAAQLLEMSVDESEAELPKMITAEVDRLTKLLDEMEGFSDTRPLNLKSHNIHSVLGHCKNVAEVGFAKGLRCVEAYDPSLPNLLCDQDLLKQVFLNLFKNAAEAILGNGPAEHGLISLSTAYQSGIKLKSGDQKPTPILVVSIEDNGGGISDDIRPNLFQPSVSNKQGGKGFGLALAAKIVAEHGGWIDFKSEDRRTRFSVHLPIRSQA